jgi:hypothetical protein
MPLHDVECFKADKLPTSKIGEFERQLKGQETGLNRLTVDEYLENIANPVKRDKAASRKARDTLKRKLQARFQRELSKEMDPYDAETAAINKARKIMSTCAGLHNPDLTAGGKDIIAYFGDRRVNSSIGPQWRSRIKSIKSAAENVPISMRESTFINVVLHKC